MKLTRAHHHHHHLMIYYIWDRKLLGYPIFCCPQMSREINERALHTHRHQFHSHHLANPLESHPFGLESMDVLVLVLAFEKAHSIQLHLHVVYMESKECNEKYLNNFILACFFSITKTYMQKKVKEYKPKIIL